MSSCEKEERNFYDGLGKKPVYVPLSELRDIRNEPPQPIQLSGTIFLQHFPQFLWILLWLAACEEHATPDIKAQAAPAYDSLTPVQQLQKRTDSLYAAATRDLALLNCIRDHLQEQMNFSKLTPLGLKKYRQAFADIQQAQDDIESWLHQFQPPAEKTEAEQMRYLQTQEVLISQKKAALILPKEFLASKKDEVRKCEELVK